MSNLYLVSSQTFYIAWTLNRFPASQSRDSSTSLMNMDCILLFFIQKQVKVTVNSLMCRLTRVGHSVSQSAVEWQRLGGDGGSNIQDIFGSSKFSIRIFYERCNLNNRLDCYWGIGGTVVKALAFHLLILLEPSAPLMWKESKLPKVVGFFSGTSVPPTGKLTGWVRINTDREVKLL